jgi:hypothetical protein
MAFFRTQTAELEMRISATLDRLVRACSHRIELDPAQLAQRYGAAAIAIERRDRLVCSHRGKPRSRMVDYIRID